MIWIIEDKLISIIYQRNNNPKISTHLPIIIDIPTCLLHNNRNTDNSLLWDFVETFPMLFKTVFCCGEIKK